MADKKIVIIPTYNEKENIENIIRKVFSLEDGFDILISTTAHLTVQPTS